MITKEEAYKIAKEYIDNKNRTYISIKEDKIYLSENVEIPYGKYKGEFKDSWVVTYEDEGYNDPLLYFITINSSDGEVLYTISRHGYVEDRELGGVYYED